LYNELAPPYYIIRMISVDVSNVSIILAIVGWLSFDWITIYLSIFFDFVWLVESPFFVNLHSHLLLILFIISHPDCSIGSLAQFLIHLVILHIVFALQLNHGIVEKPLFLFDWQNS
jgi:hypothetical protein